MWQWSRETRRRRRSDPLVGSHDYSGGKNLKIRRSRGNEESQLCSDKVLFVRDDHFDDSYSFSFSASTNFRRHGKQREILNSLSFVSLSSPHLWRERGLLGPISLLPLLLSSWIIRKLELLPPPPSRGEERAKPPKRGGGRKTAIGRQGNKEKMGRGGGGGSIWGREEEDCQNCRQREKTSSFHPPVNLHWWHRPHYFPPSSSLHRSLPTRRRQRQNRGERLIHSPTDKKDFLLPLSPILPPFVHHCHPPSLPSFIKSDHPGSPLMEGGREKNLALPPTLFCSSILSSFNSVPPYFLRSCLVAW